MATEQQPKEGPSFLRKVARFVTNPATDWADINTREEDRELEKSELKAMIERKRRNDFVRKREFDMLRKVRHEGLTPEQVAALGGTSRVDDSEVRMPDSTSMVRAEYGVKEKIDQIEKQMVGEGLGPSSRRAADFFQSPTLPAEFPAPPGSPGMPASLPVLQIQDSDHLPALPPLPDFDPGNSQPLPFGRHSAPTRPADPPPSPSRPDRSAPPAYSDRGNAPARAPVAQPAGAMPPQRPSAPRAAPTPAVPFAAAPVASAPVARAPVSPVPLPISQQPTRPSALVNMTGDLSGAMVEVSEVVHDPELDEAVIAFANADFTHCEQSISQLTRRGAPRHLHAETWLVLFDLYRATGQQPSFDALAMEYVELLGRSPPQWFSLPKQVSDAAAEERPATARMQGDVGWVSPAVLDFESVGRLRSTTLQLPLPWVFDWAPLARVEPEAAAQLGALFRQWARQPLDMRWRGGEHLLDVLQEASPTGVRDADPVYWMTRLDALRLANRPDQFDETAIDYCVTYEVSPPSWEPAQCAVRISSSHHSTSAAAMSVISEVATSFLESGLSEDSHVGVPQVSVELSGQLVGDIGPTIAKIDRQLGKAQLVQVTCSKLIRVDFIAAGDLLNWVLVKRSEGRSVTFNETHRLVALFFGAMGINEHARVLVRRD